MYDVEQVRRELPILQECVYLNTGTFGVMAEPVLKPHLERLARFERSGHVGYAGARESHEAARASLASLIGSQPSQIAIGKSTTEAVNWAIQSMRLLPGSEVIVSAEEHPGVLFPWLAAARTNQLHIRFVDAHPSPELFVERLRLSITDRTAAIALSHVSTETGTRLQMEHIRDIVPQSVVLMVDVAQSLGQLPVSAHALGADFIVGNTYKWLAGPKGVGFLWFREPAPGVPPAFTGAASFSHVWARSAYQGSAPPLDYADGLTQYEYGSGPFHLTGGIADAVAYLESLGWESIYAHMREMAVRARKLLVELPWVTLLSPDNEASASAIIAFGMDGVSGKELSPILWNEYGIIQRSTDGPDGVRISCSYFTNVEDLQRLVSAVRAIHERVAARS